MTQSKCQILTKHAHVSLSSGHIPFNMLSFTRCSVVTVWFFFSWYYQRTIAARSFCYDLFFKDVQVHRSGTVVVYV